MNMDFRQRPRKLNLNAPLLSTRRYGSATADETGSTNSRAKFQETSDRIPFCWEQTPGKPKDSSRNCENTHDTEFHTPRLRMPPARWRPRDRRNEEVSNANRGDLNRDDGFRADVDDDDDDHCNENNSDTFSDAVDVLSLTEAIDIAEKAEENHHGLEGFNLESLDSNNNNISPSYIIERFLPDATALAASSVMENASKNLMNSNPRPYRSNYMMEHEADDSSWVPNGCGLNMLISWRMKHRICGVRSSVRHGCANVVQPQRRSKSKSSIVRPFGDSKKQT